jgi:ATP-dependent exoDNAse (exonuclease V) beta subunit
MGTGTLTIYSASAGSGKTHKLAGIYLSSLFRSRFSYRHILAVTFTNKATSEMKSRILDQLDCLANGKQSDYLPGIIKETGKSEDRIRQEASEILFSVLHDYSRFSVCTIDAFFQKILRAFAREAGLYSGFNIEIDHTLILSSAVDEMITSSAGDKKLLEWLRAYIYANLDEDKSWNLKEGIMKLAAELFREKFIILSEQERSKLEDKDFLLKYIKNLKDVSDSFEKNLLDSGKNCTRIFADFGLTDDMFYRKGQGIPSFVRSLASGIIRAPNGYVKEIFSEPPRWSRDKIPVQLQKAIDSGLERELKEVISFYDKNISDYNSAEVILSNIYTLGILSDVLNNVHRITSSENNFLISDAGHLLNLIIKEDQAPFIYEKTGNRFENFMIDEFQDTSIIQWENFKPLISNSMSEGYDNLVVGDVKQSIYRWRNSDWSILGKMEHELVDNERYFSQSLKTNWRSRTNIIRFNNSLFSVIPNLVDEKLSGLKPSLNFKHLFAGAQQEDPGINRGGYVKIEFIRDETADDEQGTGGVKKKFVRKWDSIVLERLPELIEIFQDNGYNASDIGILVRDGREGASVLRRIIEYSNSCSPEKKIKYNYGLVSSDSLTLSGSPAVIFLISVISVLNNPDDILSRALMLRFYLLATGVKDADMHSLDRDRLISESTENFPQGYEKFLESIKNLPLFEITENVISFFGLGKYPWNVAYLNTFQDWVISYLGNKNSGLQAFLEWWESTGKTKSVVLPGTQDAARVLTMHKSKGLEFRIVILPFLSWNLDHKNTRHPFLWVKPGKPPFSELGILPVKYSSALADTIFADDYRDEKFSVHLDNINLLYVAMTRARDAIYGFAPAEPGRENEIAEVIRNAITCNDTQNGNFGFMLKDFYNADKGVFEYGEIVGYDKVKPVSADITSLEYPVTFGMRSLKLKLHGENYFSPAGSPKKDKINYGKLMHEVFERINTPDDIRGAVMKLVSGGKVSVSESNDLKERIMALIDSPQVSEWFLPGNIVMTEAEILLPSGITRRPDRVILRDGKTIIVDFKFGEENPDYFHQVRQYKTLISEMGYAAVEAFIWYVDKNKVISV